CGRRRAIPPTPRHNACWWHGLGLGASLPARPVPGRGAAMTDRHWSIAIHGGAGTLSRDTIGPDEEREVRAALTAARGAGSAILSAGGAALDAVESAVRKLEDAPQFNAGRGATLTFGGEFELDAAVMDGQYRAAGAVTGVRTVK